MKTGAQDPLLPLLAQGIDAADSVDLAVAFAMDSGAVTGHKTLAEVQRYTESAMREGLADEAFAKLISRPNREQTVANLPQRFVTKTNQAIDTKGK